MIRGLDHRHVSLTGAIGNAIAVGCSNSLYSFKRAPWAPRHA